MHRILAMTRCSQCGEETELLIKGTPVCICCDGKTEAGGRTNTRLEVARNEYRMALWAQREALVLKHSLDQNDSDGSLALHNANLQLEKTAAKYDEALREFVAEQANRRRSS